MAATTVSVCVWPGVHLVPEAMACTTDQEPLAHCWNELPPTQLNTPSVVQGPDCAPPEPLTGAEGPDEGAATGGDDGTTLGAGLTEDAATDEALGAKTPPVLLGGAAEVAEGPEVGEDGPLADWLEPEPVEAPQLGPMGGAKGPDPSRSTDGPGLGNRMFPPFSSLRHPVPILATNIFGAELRLLKLPAARLVKTASSMRLPSSRLAVPLPDPPPPPVTVIGAQFMYISWLPTLLNQVQARV